MKEECKKVLEKYYKHCQSKYFEKHSLHYLHCQKLIQEYQKCIELKKHLTNRKFWIEK